jgi:hypothetical protein
MLSIDLDKKAVWADLIPSLVGILLKNFAVMSRSFAQI